MFQTWEKLNIIPGNFSEMSWSSSSCQLAFLDQRSQVNNRITNLDTNVAWHLVSIVYNLYFHYQNFIVDGDGIPRYEVNNSFSSSTIHKIHQ